MCVPAPAICFTNWRSNIQGDRTCFTASNCPPAERTPHPNYVEGDVGVLEEACDAGVCIEVIEHLTPRMLGKLVDRLAKVSLPCSLWLFNTDMPDYVINE